MLSRIRATYEKLNLAARLLLFNSASAVGSNELILIQGLRVKSEGSTWVESISLDHGMSRIKASHPDRSGPLTYHAMRNDTPDIKSSR